METAAAVVVIVGAPILSSMDVSFSFVEHIATRLFLILALIYSMRQGAIPGLLAFLAVFTLLIERNHEVLTSFPYQTPTGTLGMAPTNNFLGLPTKLAPLPPTPQTVVYDSPENQEKADASDLHDNIPHLPAGPRSTDAPAFYKSKGLILN
jgi:hypothetical protein